MYYWTVVSMASHGMRCPYFVYSATHPVSKNQNKPNSWLGKRKFQQIWNYRKYGIIAKVVNCFRILKGGSLPRTNKFEFPFFSWLKHFDLSFLWFSFNIAHSNQYFRVKHLIPLRLTKKEKRICQYWVSILCRKRNHRVNGFEKRAFPTIWNYRENGQGKWKTPPVRNYREHGRDFSFIKGFLISREFHICWYVYFWGFL